MSITQSRNVEYLCLGKTVSSQPGNDEAISELAEGEIGIFSVGGVRRDTSDTDGNFIIVVGGANSKPAFVSEAIKASSVKAISTAAATAATEQKDSIGYNGTSGSIATLTASNLYMVDVMVQELLTSNTDGRYIKHFQWKSGSTAPTQADVAAGLLKSAINNFSREAEDYMSFEMLLSDAGVATTGTVDVVNGSLSAVASVPGDFEVGGYFRAGTATTDPVYKVAGISGTTLTLDSPYQGTSGQLAIAAAEGITSALAGAANAGLTLEGAPLEFTVGKLHYKQVSWELVLKDFGSTVSVREANADKGMGTYKEVSEKEWFLKGFEGEGYRMGEPTIYSFAGKADSTKEYDITTIVFEDSSLVGFQNEVSPKQISIASPDDNGATDYMADGTGGVWAVLAQLTGLTVNAV